eukprot:CAMPEP_0197021536 /NCGR_PEP_ID=MMETSP1384-20130603/2430_1 /TAXON_ID=29189 /ORGANISM="Ammonia sp." /LENGTH=484 /DNA_ID=CAMNT_0042449379 /DNA_START=38 /DNA_END=1489 /DNA_ORIENTATION=-
MSSKPPNESIALLSVNDHSINLGSYESYDSFGKNPPQHQHQVYQVGLNDLPEDDTESLLNETFLRKTLKFWVLPSNFTAVKRRILRHLSEITYDGKIIPQCESLKHLEESGKFYGSIYFDTDTLSLYDNRIRHVEESMLFRYRWYERDGSLKCGRSAYFEQKYRKKQWHGEVSKKHRFQIEPKLVRTFLKNGPKSISKIASRVDFIQELYQDTQRWDSKLQPTLRSEYRRTAYQDSESRKAHTIRITFDEGITLSDISSFAWEQALDPSIEITEPFKTFCFPLGILEVKLNLSTYDEINLVAVPDWIYALQNAGFIIQVDKFSKYCTGISVMNLGQIERVPSWIAAIKTLMEVELARKGQEWFSMDKLPKWEIQENVNIPTRVEPREFMANERTLLKWVRMCFLALFVGLGLLGFQYEPITGSVLIIFSLIILFRSYWMYRIRLKMLIQRNFQDPFHDPWGPPLLVALFVLPTITYLAYSLGLW